MIDASEGSPYVLGHFGRRNLGPWLAALPGAFVFLLEGLAWLYAALAGGLGSLHVVSYGFPVAVVAGIIVPVLLLAGGRKDGLVWAVVSVCLTLLGLFFAFLFWLGAVSIGCGGQAVCFG